MSAHSSQADRFQFFMDTYKPVTLGHGTWYNNRTAGDILAYTRPIPGPRPSMSKSNSVRKLTNFLNNQWPNAKVKDALDRINQVISTPDWGPDILVKILPDLDVAFFDGYLRSRVQASWQDGFSAGQAFARVLGNTNFDKMTNTCHIRLNRYIICFGTVEPRQQMLHTLIHEMVHAWDLLTYPHLPQDPLDTYEDWVSGHGWHFRWLLNLLDERTRGELGFGVIAKWENYRIASMAFARGNFPF